MKPREQRRKVFIPSRMQAGAVWVDVCIHNISSRGLLVRAERPPPPGTYVDIRRGTKIIIGRAVWQRDGYFGVRVQDRLDIEGLISEPRLANRPAPPAAEAPPPDRRAARRQTTEADIAAQAERSRRFSSAFQFGLMLVGCGAAAIFVGFEVHHVLSRPMAAAQAAMAGEH